MEQRNETAGQFVQVSQHGGITEWINPDKIARIQYFEADPHGNPKVYIYMAGIEPNESELILIGEMAYKFLERMGL